MKTFIYFRRDETHVQAIYFGALDGLHLSRGWRKMVKAYFIN